MKHRAFTFGAFNPLSIEADFYFLLRCVVREDVQLDSLAERIWNQRKLRELRQTREVRELVSDPKHRLSTPTGLAISVGDARRSIQTEGRRILGDVDLRKELRIGSVPPDDAAKLIEQGTRLWFRPRSPLPLREAAVYRLLPRWNERPFARGRIVRSTSFKLREDEVAACTLRVDCPAQSAAVLHLEQWVVGTDGDLDRPLPSELLFLFPADAQIVDDVEPFYQEAMSP